jgi:hypothetical protein
MALGPPVGRFALGQSKRTHMHDPALLGQRAARESRAVQPNVGTQPNARVPFGLRATGVLE